MLLQCIFCANACSWSEGTPYYRDGAAVRDTLPEDSAGRLGADCEETLGTDALDIPPPFELGLLALAAEKEPGSEAMAEDAPYAVVYPWLTVRGFK